MSGPAKPMDPNVATFDRAIEAYSRNDEVGGELIAGGPVMTVDGKLPQNWLSRALRSIGSALNEAANDRRGPSELSAREIGVLEQAFVQQVEALPDDYEKGKYANAVKNLAGMGRISSIAVGSMLTDDTALQAAATSMHERVYDVIVGTRGAVPPEQPAPDTDWNGRAQEVEQAVKAGAFGRPSASQGALLEGIPTPSGKSGVKR